MCERLDFAIGASFEGTDQTYVRKVTLAAGTVLNIEVAVHGNDANVSRIMVGLMTDDAGTPGRFIAGGDGGVGNTDGFHMSSDFTRFVAVPLMAKVSAGDYWLAASVVGIFSLAYDSGGSDGHLSTAQLSDVQGTGQGIFTSDSRNYSIRALFNAG